MSSLTRNCRVSGKSFVITDEDQAFYDKMGVPLPTLCPEERRRRRLAIRNEVTLYNRKCDRTGKTIVSQYAPGIPYVIWSTEEWWKDDWDPLDYGRPFDFSRSFFEQFVELQRAVPRMALNNIKAENSRYVNYALGNKDCYLVYTADENEKCYYCRFSDRNYQCMDCDFTYDSRFCLQLLNAENCENCFYSQKIKNSSSLYFCYNLQNCHNCLFTVNEQNKQYMIFNQSYMKEEWESRLKDLKLETYEGLKKALEVFAELLRKTPRKYFENKNCEDCIGDYLVDCKNVIDSYDCFRCRDIKFSTHLYESHDCYDWDFVGYRSELCYEMASSGIAMNRCRFSMNSWEGNSNVTYVDLCLGSSDLFGCVGLRKKRYCILNKQYTKEEYEALVPQIIEHMKKTQFSEQSEREGEAPSSAEIRQGWRGRRKSLISEWGEFFPISNSPFAYNESVAFEYFPLTKEQANARGYRWKEEDEVSEYQGQKTILPNSVFETDEPICQAILRCEETEKLYKIIPREFKLYQKFGIALPRFSPMARHKKRMQFRNARQFYERSCLSCGQMIKTSYGPNHPEKVYCESCYLKIVY